MILNEGCKHLHHIKLRSNKHMIKFVSSTGSIQNTIDEPKDKYGDSTIEMGNRRFLKKK